MAQNRAIRHSLKAEVQHFPGKSSENPGTGRWSRYGWITTKLVLLILFVAFTNPNVGQRVGVLLAQGRLGTLLPYFAVWGLAGLALAVAVLQPNRWIRFFWAAVLAASTAAAWGYYSASQSEFNVFDIISLWNARHETDRAAEFYARHVQMAGLVLLAGFVIMSLPGSPKGRLGKWLTRLSWFPLVPVAAMAAIVILKSGGGSQALPQQFSPLALASVAASKIAFQSTPARAAVTWQPASTGPRENIVILMDESIGADFIDLTPGNPHTPGFAKYASRFVNFGRAVSGGNCSNYSNAIVRFGASRIDVAGSINASPTLWQYAKAAGYRTVFIDAQAGNISNPGLMQNFMTLQEKNTIDVFHAIRGVAAADADMQLADILAKELQSNQPTFIYANKNGAHFPYDEAYPASAAIYHPTMTQAGKDTTETRIASYRNAIRWSVDTFIERLFTTANVSNTTLLYTSDHAQIFDPTRLTHCIVDAPEAQMAVVPLLVTTPDPAKRQALENGARLLQGKASHFQIVPTVLSWMGYAQADIASRYDESLTTGTTRLPAFTSGDVFGLFSSEIFWWPADLSKDLRDPAAKTILPTGGT